MRTYRVFFERPATATATATERFDREIEAYGDADALAVAYAMAENMDNHPATFRPGAGAFRVGLVVELNALCPARRHLSRAMELSALIRAEMETHSEP